MRLLKSITGLVVAVPVILAVLAVNGGYVYKTQCPHIDGSTETSWSYRINDVIPYVGYSRTGCQVHTATRMALAWTGIWRLHSSSALATSTAPSHQGDYSTADFIHMEAHCVRAGKSKSFCNCATTELTRAFSRAELVQISSVSRYDQLPHDLATRAYAETSAVARDCH